MTSKAVFRGNPLAGISVLLAEPDFDSFKQKHMAARAAPDTERKDAFDLLALILGRAAPERIATPMGHLPLDADLLHEREITGGLMPTAEYRHGTSPQSKAVRDTVLAFFAGAYPDKATYDLGRISPIRDNPRTGAAWPGLSIGRGDDSTLGPLSAIKAAERLMADPDARKSAIGRALAEYLGEGAFT